MRARDLFWRLGFQRASLPELEAATGLRRGSLYAQFPDKTALLLDALDLYGREALGLMDRTMAPGSGREGVLAWARLHVERAHGADGRRGCLLIATAMEMAPHEPRVARLVTRIFDAMLERLTAAIAAVSDPPATPAATARALLSVLEGLRVLGKCGQSAGAAKAALELSLRGLILQSTAPRISSDRLAEDASS